MNTKKLKEAEKNFLKKFPGGFTHPEMVAIGKKHKMEKLIEQANENFKKAKFKNPLEILENYHKLVSRSSMVSVFEKPKFKDFVNGLGAAEAKTLATGLQKMLHSNQKQGFEMMLEVLTRGKLAKWSLISVVPAYFHPGTEVFIKPTTAKGVIEYFDLKGLEYKPRPTWEFYEKYRDHILQMKKVVSKTLSPNNAAFSGFLMMTMGEQK